MGRDEGGEVRVGGAHLTSKGIDRGIKDGLLEHTHKTAEHGRNIIHGLKDGNAG